MYKFKIERRSRHGLALFVWRLFWLDNRGALLIDRGEAWSEAGAVTSVWAARAKAERRRA